MTIVAIAVGAILGKYGLALLAVAGQAGGGAATNALLRRRRPRHLADGVRRHRRRSSV